MLIGIACNGAVFAALGSNSDSHPPAGIPVGSTSPDDSNPRVSPIPIGCSEGSVLLLLLLITLEKGVASAVWAVNTVPIGIERSTPP